MDDLKFAAWALIIVVIIIFLIIRSISNTKKHKTSKQHSPNANQQFTAYKNEYRYKKRPYLLTQNEYHFYKALVPIANEKSLTICPKVRLADIIEPQKGQHWKGAFAKIKSKHIDFLLCEGPLIPILAIELDDNSHNRAERIERDQFVDQALQQSGIPIIHTQGNGNLKEKIESTILSCCQ